MSATVRSSGELTADATIVTGRALLSDVLVITDGTNPATVVLYDNTAASGDKVFEAVVAGANNTGFFAFNNKVFCENGLHLDISGTGASCIVYHG
jgi:hypothetical protein